MRSAHKKVAVVSTVYLLFLAFMVGCSLDRWAAVEEGMYIVASGEGAVILDGIKVLQFMEVNKNENTVVFYLDDGLEIMTSFNSRAKSDWPAGCPTNFFMTHMQVLDLEVDKLTIGSNSIKDPILVRDCPSNPERIVLRQDGEFGGGGTACPNQQKCIYFARR